ncbi:sugar phosphate isomerase/epimerase, partial [Candidatus Micrarchaeota archaeon]|nr:sugar phosphate isomerase/epimerase [Candidatus Micrarchaeota archaeon]
MKFGYPVWYGTGSVPKGIETAAKLGFDYVEWALDYKWPEGIDESKATAVKKTAKENGIEIAFHAPWAGIEIAHPREGIRKASLQVQKDCIGFAEQFEPLYFNMHVSGRTEVHKLEFAQWEVMNIAMQSLQELSKFSIEKGVPLLIENNPRKEFGLTEQFSKLLEIEEIGLCLDVGHAVRTEY